MIANMDKFSAIAFDFDGTLVDTMPLHFEAYRRVFATIGISLSSEDFYNNIGGKASETIPLFLAGRESSLSVAEIHKKKKDTFAQLLDTTPPRVLPTARLLPIFYKVSPMALVSAGSRPGIMQILDKLGWTSIFDVIVTGEDCKKSKPDPEPYLVAARKLCVDTTGMLAFEDTVAGLDSAKAAGMVVINVSQI
jgi:beta-phosphoglucomutase